MSRRAFKDEYGRGRTGCPLSVIVCDGILVSFTIDLIFVAGVTDTTNILPLFTMFFWPLSTQLAGARSKLLPLHGRNQRGQDRKAHQCTPPGREHILRWEALIMTSIYCDYNAHAAPTVVHDLRSSNMVINFIYPLLSHINLAFSAPVKELNTLNANVFPLSSLSFSPILRELYPQKLNVAGR
ncbi:hypothetical protein BDQ17DRAFT_1439718 [Cyathus striatus]|nr:hypothetical protein BDQ17DRAFT_1439718 [Cyathus striatus]